MQSVPYLGLALHRRPRLQQQLHGPQVALAGGAQQRCHALLQQHMCISGVCISGLQLVK